MILPELSADVPEALAEAQRGDRRARDRIVLGEMAVVRRIARVFVVRLNAPAMEDLEQIGVVGVLVAIDTYRPTLGTWKCRVASMVLQEIRHAMRSAPMVRPPQSGGRSDVVSLDACVGDGGECWIDRLAGAGRGVEDVVERMEVR